MIHISGTCQLKWLAILSRTREIVDGFDHLAELVKSFDWTLPTKLQASEDLDSEAQTHCMPEESHRECLTHPSMHNFTLPTQQTYMQTWSQTAPHTHTYLPQALNMTCRYLPQKVWQTPSAPTFEVNDHKVCSRELEGETVLNALLQCATHVALAVLFIAAIRERERERRGRLSKIVCYLCSECLAAMCHTCCLFSVCVLCIGAREGWEDLGQTFPRSSKRVWRLNKRPRRNSSRPLFRSTLRSHCRASQMFSNMLKPQRLWT